MASNGNRTVGHDTQATAATSGAPAVMLLISIVAALVAAFAFSSAALASADAGAVPPAISSDKPDYAPGELVTLRGSNWRAGETVTIDVNDNAGQTWRRTVDVTADADGNIVDSFNLPDWFVALYTVTATGPESGTAVTSFTDGNVKVASDSGRHFGYTVTLYSSNNCTTGAGQPSTKTADANGSTTGVGGTESLLIVANLNANAPNASATFSHWTTPPNTQGEVLQFAPGYSATDRTVCVVGFVPRTRDLIGHYIANAAPVANPDGYSVNEDAVLNVAAPGLLGNDTDANGNPLTAALVAGTSNGTLVLNANGSFTYTPNANYFGSDSFTYRANDGFANSNTATVSLTINPVNDAPSFTKGADQTVAEDAGAQTVSPWATSVSAGPANESGQALTFSASNNNNALFSAQPAIAANGTLSYTPAANAHGSATVTVSLSDNGGTGNGGVDTSPSQTFAITVTPVNDAPACSPGSETTAEDTPKSLTLSCADVDGNPLTYTIVADPTNGSLTGTAPALTYNPNLNYHGSDSFTLKANDGTIDSNTATFSLTITPVNDAPDADDDSYSTDEDTTLNVAAPGVLGNDSDVEGSALTAVLVAGPASGTLTLNPDGSFDYEPDENLNGSDSFTYMANDGTLDSNVATVSITVNAVNDAPVCEDVAITTDEDTVGSVAPDCSDVENDTLTYSIVTQPANGDASVNGDDELEYVPDENFNGSDSFTYLANDGALDSNIANVTVTVNAVNDAPVAGGDTASGTEDTELVIDPADLLANDTDVDNEASDLSVTEVGSASGGTVALNGDGDVVFVPEANLCGDDVAGFSYTVSDGELTDTGVVSISLTCVNDPPVVTVDNASVNVDEGETAENTGTWSDVEGDEITLDASVGTVTKNGDGTWSWSYETTDGPAQSATVTITADDGPDTGSAGFDLTVDNVAPSATFGAPATVDEGDDIALTLTDPSDPSSVDTAAGFQYAFDCGAGYGLFGPDTESICPTTDNGLRTVKGKIRDKDGSETAYTAVVKIENVAPAVTAGADGTADEGTLTSFALGSFIDPGADSPWSVVVDWGDGSADSTFNVGPPMTPTFGSSDPYPLGMLGHVYDDDEPGPYTVTITVTDKDGGFDSDTFGVTVRNVAPSAALGNNGPVDEGSPATISFSNQADVSTADTAAGFRYAYNCGDGSFPTPPTYAGASPDASHECTFADDGSYTVSAAIVDKDDGYSVYQTDVVVENVDPAVTAAANQVADEGASTSFDLGSFLDPGADSPWHVNVDWGDGSTDSSFELTSTGPLGSSSHSYDDNDTYTVTVTVTDKDGGSGAASFEVEVANIAPSATFNDNSPVEEGSDISLSLTDPSDASSADTAAGFEYAFNCGSGYGSFGGSSTATCPTDDNGSRDVKGKIRDKDGGETEYTATVSITNVAPTATLSNNGPADEGSPATVSFADQADASGADEAAAFHYAYDCDGGSFPTSPTYAGASSDASHQCTFADDGTYTVSAAIIDKDDGFTVYETDVVVRNVAPTATINGAPASSPEGTAINLTSTVSDPGTEDTHTYAWSVTKNGSSYGSGGTGNSFSFTPDDNGSYGVTLKVTDDDGGEGTDSKTIDVTNVAPTATINGAPASSPEGTAINLTSTLSDPGTADTHAYAWSVTRNGNSYGSDGTGDSFSFTPDDNGSYVVTLEVTDDDDGEGTDSETIAVTNVAPSVTFDDNGPVAEGSSIELSLTDPSDPSDADTAEGFEYAFDCGSGYGSFGNSSTASCATNDNGSRSVKGKIRDKDGGEAEYTATVSITNVAPTATFTAAPATVNEGSTFTLSLTGPSDPSTADTTAGFTYAFDCGDGSGYGLFGPSNTASCSTSDNGTRAVNGKIRDKDGGETEYTGSVTVTNVAPTVTITSPTYGSLYTMGSTVNVVASFGDVGTGDTHTCEISWDNGLGTTSGSVTEANGSGTCSDSRTLNAAGVYTIRVTIKDDDGGSGFDETLVVVYDPNVGHVTGGGWFTSQAGAYRPDPTLAGRANFGFNAKYLKGAKTPSGNTEFQFHAGSLNFHSTNYEWLVVAGAKGQFKGTGTINGSGNYGFLLTVTDGQLSGGGGSDKFRMKIWDKSNGDTIVYDNQPGSDDIDSSGTQAIQGGSIVILKGR